MRGAECHAGMESHAGQVFTCVGALALADSLHLLDRDLLCWWYASSCHFQRLIHGEADQRMEQSGLNAESYETMDSYDRQSNLDYSLKNRLQRLALHPRTVEHSV